ncbi:Syntaxin-16 [Phytophthora cactorum]|nr:Syntaxin-16 [Phytophthora cactorum]
MATRELTRQFLQLRADEKAKVLRRKNIVSHREEGNALIKSADQEATSVAIAPGWVDVVNGTNQHVARIKEMMEKLNKLHTSRLMVRFDGQESKYEREIDQLTQDITDEFRSAEKGLRRMAQSDRNGEFSAADAKTRQNVQRALATQLQTLSGDFRKSQKTYLARVKNQKEGPVEFDFLAENDAKQKRRGGADTAQVTEVEIAEDVINERDQEIQRIATSITELATIFKELAVLVIDQGTILDRIDYNMEQVVEQTEKGIEELEKAEETQKNSRPVKCIGLLLVMIFVMTVLLVLKHSLCNPSLLSYFAGQHYTMEVEVKQQQALTRSLRVFVDALRDIKKTEDLARPIGGAGTEENGATDAPNKRRSPRRRGSVKSAGLFGAAGGCGAALLLGRVPSCGCWVLMPIEKRRPTRTLEISKDVLMWGYRGYTQVVDAELKSEETTIPADFTAQVRGGVASSASVWRDCGGYKAPTPVQAEFIRLREMVLRVLPLRMSMSSLRAALGQATPAANEQMWGDPEKYATALCTQQSSWIRSSKMRALYRQRMTKKKKTRPNNMFGLVTTILEAGSSIAVTRKSSNFAQCFLYWKFCLVIHGLKLQSSQSFEEVLREAEQDLSSQLVPLRARGVVTLTKLRSVALLSKTLWRDTPQVRPAVRICVLGLHPPTAFPEERVERIQNKAAKRVQLIQEVQSDEEKTAATKELQHPTSAPESEQELLAAATLRASYVLTCVFGVLQLELELGGKRRPKPGASDATEDDEQQRLRSRKQQHARVAVRRGLYLCCVIS